MRGLDAHITGNYGEDQFKGMDEDEDTPSLDTSFHDHELGRDAEGRSEHCWRSWLKRAEKLLGISNLDGDEDADGYSLDTAHDYYERGETAASYAEYVRAKHRGMYCGDHCPNSCTWCGAKPCTHTSAWHKEGKACLICGATGGAA